jgi:hypothetical protein
MKDIRFGILLFLLAFSILSLESLSQEIKSDKKQLKKAERKARDKFLSSGFGVLKMSGKDKATSPLLYSGPTAMLDLEYLVHSDNIIKTFDLSAAVGILRTDKNAIKSINRGQAIGINFNFHFDHLHRSFKKEGRKLKYYLGGGLDFSNYSRVNYKFQNALYNYEYMFSLGLAGRMELPFSYKSKKVKFLGMNFNRRDRDLRLSWQMYIPVFTSIYRPNYVSILNFADPDVPLINPDNFKAGIFSYFQFRSKLELFYILHNGNQLKLSYLWEFYQYNPGYNKVQGALNGAYFSFIFRLNNNGGKNAN